MRFSSILAGAAAVFSVGVYSQGDCSGGPFQSGLMWTGGGDGDGFCETKYKSGIIIKGIEVWANSKVVRAIQFKYSDNSLSPVHGVADGDRHNRIEWDPAAAVVEKITLWGNGVGTRLGRIYVRLSDGKEFDVGKDTSGQSSYEQSIGTGIMLGAFGGQGADINRLGFLFLGSKVKKIAITNIKIDEDLATLNSQRAGITNQLLAEDNYTNKKLNSSDTHGFWNTITKTDSKKFSQGSTTTFGGGVSVEVSGEIFGLGAKASTEFNWQVQKLSSSETSSEIQRVLQWRSDSVVPPGASIRCKAFAQLGEFDGTYTSQVQVHTESGVAFTFSEKGRLESASWSEAFSFCEDTNGENNQIINKRRVRRGQIGA